MFFPARRETLPSYLSRLAASRGVTPPDLSYDLGVSFRRVLNQDPDAVGRLAAWTGLTAVHLAELLSWTGEPIGDVRMRFRGETFVSRALRNPVLRGCPDCLRQDAAVPPRSLEAMSLRGDWQLREVAMCVCHKRPLSVPWSVDTPDKRHDVRARLAEVMDALDSGQLDLPCEELTPYDLWLDRRLKDGTDETFLGARSLYAATTICRILGGELLRLQDVQEDNPRRRLRPAQAAGFEVISQGNAVFRSALDLLAADATGSLDELPKAFGELFVKLDVDYRDEKASFPFRRILRNCILDVGPIGPGEKLLGKAVATRRLHSVRTAAREARVPERLMKKFLVEAGAVDADGTRPDSRNTFDAEPYGQLLDDIPMLVGPKAMCAAIGCTRGELQTLEHDGVLTPRIRIATTKSRWLVADGLALLSELDALSVKNAVHDEDGWEQIHSVQVRKGIPVGQIIAAIRAGAVRVRRAVGRTGYGSFQVSEADVTRLIQATPAFAAPRTAVLSLAAFGRSMGLRDGRALRALAEAGHIQAVKQLNPATHRMQFNVTDEDVEAFHRTFLTPASIGTEVGLDWHSARAVLKAGGVKPFSPDGRNYGSIYLRREAKHCLVSRSSQS
ncbi:TniQ family protein [Paracoccus sp. Z118]|uniref:TniQ family protein n=1 Tax=Paracoccus sp. Z118 TaxID=2851017 RepID=UPI001C2CBCD4|nr:TniQ family protein [Paracoccus sp. Z118]MBV0893002.1 TniQ family protein [Paracoccus sp. Z118]